jgi:flagellar hook protein FlgE
MSLSSSLFTGTSGLKNMGNALQVVGNNISNLNTIGFKKGRATFADTLYENVATQAGTAQMGRGMAVGDVSQNFSQGSFESTGNTTDLSIGGDGFFIMRQSNSQNTFYTRAGNFFFNKGGQLVNPEGYVVQGWNLDEETGEDIGSITDLVLAEFTSPPKKSETITAITNLNADALSKAVVLSNVWDSGDIPYIASGNYEYQTVIKAYDALGSTHDITITYDKKSGTEWEYIVTMNPDEDNRNLVQNTDSKGLLARGTIKFSQSSGDILDFTMSKFTGRIGNFTANGVNTVKNVDYEISDYDSLALDGYGFSLEFNGSSWSFTDVNKDGLITAVDLPANYGNAKIVYSDNQNIYLTLNPTDAADVEPDLRIKLAQPAVATDNIGFDINNQNDLHIQGIEGLTYFGDAANDNTTLEINAPGVMTKDVSNLSIVWNPVAKQWYWSNPSSASSAGTLVTGASTNSPARVNTTATNFLNVPDITMVASGISLIWDERLNGGAGAWDWNMPLKATDFANEVFSFSPANSPVLSIISTSSNEGEGALATVDATGTAAPVTLTWDGVAWSAAGGGTLGAPVIDVAQSSSTQVRFSITQAGGSTSVIQYAFGSPLTATAGQNLSFEIDPSPPLEYRTASVSTSATDGILIDFDSDLTNDIEFNAAIGGAGSLLAGDSFRFSTNPNRPPAEYANATLKGDQKEAVIDLDGSGNEKDKRDIVFSFTEPLKYGASTHPYNDRSVISFDIKGSTAWSDISKDQIKKTGYFEFTADFLGGEFGTTETDIKLNIGTKYDGINFVNDSLSTTQYAKSSSTIFQDADGYSAGDLQGVDVASDGILTGIYSNGQLIPLFRIGLAKFLNNYGLSSEGGNLFRETRASGGAITNKPGENGLGTLAPNSLEMSNVDISEEFVAMIVQQRGFQANSKTVTTVDEMMQTVINMKR